MSKLQDYEKQNEQVERLTNVIGGALCSAKLFCKEQKIDECSKCTCAGYFQPIAVKLYKEGVRLPEKAEKPKPDAEKEELRKSVAELKSKAKKLNKLNKQYKERIDTLMGMLKRGEKIWVLK